MGSRRNESSDRKSEDSVQRGQKGQQVHDSGVVNGGGSASSAPTPSKPSASATRKSSSAVESSDSKRKSLKDFKITKSAVMAVEAANMKADKARKAREEAGNTSPVPFRRAISPSPSPPRPFTFGSSMAFSSMGEKSPSKNAEPDESHLSARAKFLMEELAREKLNRQSLGRVAELSASGTYTGSSDKAQLPPVPVPQVLPGAIHAPSAATDMMAVMMMDMQSRLADLQARQSGVPPSGFQPLYAAAAALPAPSPSGDQSKDDSEEEFEDESPVAMWSGLHQEFKTDSAQISDAAKEFWAMVTSTDEKGRSELGFKKPSKKSAGKIKFFTQGDDLTMFRPPECNSEIPQARGAFHIKEEEDVVNIQKGIGAAASSACTAVDASRSLVDDILSAAQDFMEGRVNDPVAEAVEVFHMTARVLEEGAISNMVNALRFMGNTFSLCNFKRHSMALRRVTAEEARKVLAISPPDSKWLFGENVKESVQKIRDSALVSKAFQARGGYGRYNYRNMGGRGGRGRTWTPYNPREKRFRGGLKSVGNRKSKKFGGYSFNYKDKAFKKEDEKE